MITRVRRPSLSRLWVLPVVLASSLGSAGFAASPDGGAKAACSTDLATFCQGIEAGGGKKMRCLMDNQSKLSPACATSIETRRATRAGRLGEGQLAQAPAAAPVPPAPGAAPVTAPPPAAALPALVPVRGAMRACRTDMATLCATIATGGGRKLRCLMDNQAKLSPDCAAAVSAGATKVKAGRAACADDAVKFCADARGPQRQQCLASNQAQLAPACAAVIAKRQARLGGGAARQP